ncbi:hypothetical protein EOD39_18511 [Acipenser ruthenus]|uniref:Uncharacterized protein n=1 Tax=Acipenser ruthenus TaxID=7906 RepID=A0A444V0T3_ACIRT|nr:hypothetical protein EOD39_18511 [Acipenser ruthenus]
MDAMEEDLLDEELLLQADEDDDLEEPQPRTSTAGSGSSNTCSGSVDTGSGNAGSGGGHSSPDNAGNSPQVAGVGFFPGGTIPLPNPPWSSRRPPGTAGLHMGTPQCRVQAPHNIRTMETLPPPGFLFGPFFLF